MGEAKWVSVLMLAVLGLLGCVTRPRPVQPSPDATLHVPPLKQPFEAPYAVFEAALFYVDAPLVDPEVALREIVSSRVTELELIAGDAEPSRLPAVFIGSPEIADYAPPSREALAFFGRGLEDAERSSVAQAKRVFTLLFVDHGTDATRAVLRASSVLIELSERTGGYVWDESTRELFSREAFQARSSRGAMSVIDQVAVHAETEGNALRISTLGMTKLGLPEIAMRHVPPDESRYAGILLHVLCQHLIEGKLPREDGVMEIALDQLHDLRVRELVVRRSSRENPHLEVLLRDLSPEEGSSEDRTVELFFGERNDPYVHARRARTFANLLGTTLTDQKN